MIRLEIPDRKLLRAYVIKDYMARAGYTAAVCFSCGNATAALRKAGVPVIGIGPDDDLNTKRWWDMAEIRRTWPHALDATSGHLPLPIMLWLGSVLRDAYGHFDPSFKYEVPTGSGETILCLRLVCPEINFVPVFDVGKGTERDERNPLLKLL